MDFFNAVESKIIEERYKRELYLRAAKGNGTEFPENHNQGLNSEGFMDNSAGEAINAILGGENNPNAGVFVQGPEFPLSGGPSFPMSLNSMVSGSGHNDDSQSALLAMSRGDGLGVDFVNGGPQQQLVGKAGVLSQNDPACATGPGKNANGINGNNANSAAISGFTNQKFIHGSRQKMAAKRKETQGGWTKGFLARFVR